MTTPKQVGRLAVAMMMLGAAGCDVALARVEALWLLWLLPAVAAFSLYASHRKRLALYRFVSPELAARVTTGVSRERQALKAVLVVAALGFGLLALAEPQYGFTWEEVRREGVDVVVALDVSDSMLVQDGGEGGSISRLERAKREITDLLRMMDGDRIGLVAFAGAAFVQCPLTLDYAAAELFLADVDTDLIPEKGTAIGAALVTALEAFDGGASESQAVVLITDGEDHSGEALAAAEQAKAGGVRVFTIGIGRQEGAPIPDAGGGFHRDRRGEMVLSRLDETTLQKIALTTGGRYVRSVAGDMDLESIYTEGIKATLVSREHDSRRRQRGEHRFQWLVAATLLLLAIEPFIPERARHRRAGSSSRATSSVSGLAAVLVIGLLAGGRSVAAAPPATAVAPPPVTAVAPPPATAVVPPPAATTAPQPAGAIAPGAATGPSTSAGEAPQRFDDPFAAYQAGLYDQALQGFVDQQVEHPQSAAVLMNVGSAHYKTKDYAAAEQAFARAAMLGDAGIREQALYNLGNTAFRQGKLEEAVKLYQSALELDANDEDAKFNLEATRDEIRRRHEEAQKRQQQQQQQSQCDQGDQGEQQQDGGEQKDGQQQQGDQAPDEQQQGAAPQPGDRDGDGLPDELEQAGKNPTDPNKPDTDGDGLQDGEEDKNRNGQVDPGETDPNKRDSDGDGVQDGDEQAGAAAAQQPEQAPGEQEMTPEEAARYLQALEDERPRPPDRRRPGRRRAPDKDW